MNVRKPYDEYMYPNFNYQCHLQNLRQLDEKVGVNLQKLEATLAHLRKISVLTKQNRSKSTNSRKKKEGRHKARVAKKRAVESAKQIGQCVKISDSLQWNKNDININELDK